MPREQKKSESPQGRPPARGGTLTGVLLGLGLGLLIASVVAYFVYQKGAPFKTLDNPNPPSTTAPLKAPEPTAAAKSSAEGKIAFPNTGSTQPGALPPPAQSAPPVAVKEAAKEVVKETAAKPAKAAAAQKEEPATGNEGGGKPLFLQAGAFTNKADAETRKAALALVGLEAKVTEITKDDKPVYRVRVGPFSSPEDATKARGDMARNGIDSVLVK
jgi:cell division protein FtsN